MEIVSAGGGNGDEKVYNYHLMGPGGPYLNGASRLPNLSVHGRDPSTAFGAISVLKLVYFSFGPLTNCYTPNNGRL